MNSTNSTGPKSINYPSATIERASRAMSCSPFQLELFATMQYKSVALQEIVGEAGVQNQYSRSLLSEAAAENALMWQIKVGLLRREVDGQGITDSFRLTPLGRQLLEQCRVSGEIAAPTWCDRLYNARDRLLQLPTF